MTNYQTDFPILKQLVNEKEITYLDSGATSQKPQVVIDAITNYYQDYNANIHRGIYFLSEKSTEAVDEARKKVANFINAKSEKEIVFTRNATESINLIAHTWAFENIEEDDEIVTTIMEHHANIVPWQILVKRKGCKLTYVDIKDDFTLDLDDLKGSLTAKTKLVTLTHVSNVLGTINPIQKVIKLVRRNSPNAKILIDACQSVPHMKLNLQKIDADFVAFSSHKMLGPTGIGVLWAKEALLEKMPPFMTGGDMISEVHTSHAKWNEIPYKFEAGTPHIAGIIGLGFAIDYLNEIGLDQIEEYEKNLTSYGLEKLNKFKGLKIVGPNNLQDRAGILTFTLENIHSHDIAEILNSENVYIRSGNHCAQPIHERLGLVSTARASLYLYNDEKDIDRLVEGLEKVRKIFD